MQYQLLAADLVALSVLVFGGFMPRHKRRDLIVAYIGVNVGVLAVTSALATNTVSAGLGLGLFGVLSIIRLRSQELEQHEIAYYFAAIAIGLLGGLSTGSATWVMVLMAIIVSAVLIGDAIGGRSVRQQLLLDRAHTSVASAKAHALAVLGGAIADLTIVKTDLVNDTTLVYVRHKPDEALVEAPAAERIPG